MDLQQQVPITCNFTKAVLAACTTTTLSTTNAATYSIGGKMYVQGAAWTNQATPTTDSATGATFAPVLANFGSIFLVGVNAAGTMKVIQGQVQALDTSGNFIVAPQFGALGFQGSGSTDNDFCPLGYIVIKAGSTADNVHGWRFGTDNMSAVTGITYAFQDVSNLPGRPQVA